MVVSFSDARALSELMLADHLPDRWRHVQAVTREALRVGGLPEVDRDALVQSAVLHDVGYSPVIARVGFHPLDGARFLATRDYPRRIVNLVAHHSAATVEAALRGVGGLEAFTDEQTPTRDALWFCDAVTGPQGQRLSPEERWAEIRQRYGPGHIVTQFLDQAEPTLRAAVERTHQRMQIAGIPPSP